MKTNTFLGRKVSKLHKKDIILHVTDTFKNKGKLQEQAVDPLLRP